VGTGKATVGEEQENEDRPRKFSKRKAIHESETESEDGTDVLDDEHDASDDENSGSSEEEGRVDSALDRTTLVNHIHEDR